MTIISRRLINERPISTRVPPEHARGFSGPSAISRGLGQLDVFARSLDDLSLMYITYDGAWSEWKSLGGLLVSDPSVTAGSATGFHQLDVFALGKDYALMVKSLPGDNPGPDLWTDWEFPPVGAPNGERLYSGPGAVASRRTMEGWRVEIWVFAIGWDHDIGPNGSIFYTRAMSPG
jgi:hypothetical protein